MEHQASTDHGTVVHPDQAAFIANADGSFGLLLPDLPDDAPVSLGHKLIIAIAVRFNDPEWIEDMLAALDAAHRDASKH
jgi:hypothetical protein